MGKDAASFPGHEAGLTDINRLRQGGVGAVFFAAYVAPE